MSTLASQPTTTLAYVPKSEPSFEFTKRKRWQDLLIAELHNTYAFILSLEGKILFCSSDTAARFGWKYSELLNTEFRKLLSRNEDQICFQAAFNEAIIEDNDTFELVVQLMKHRTKQVQGDRRDSVPDGDIFLRLKCSAVCSPMQTHNSSESRGMGPPPLCEFALLLAMPFSSKNPETLYSVMDLNAQIIRNVERIIELREHLPPDAVANLLNPGSGCQPVSMYATSSLYTSSTGINGLKVSQSLLNSTSGLGSRGFEVPPSIQPPTVPSGSFHDHDMQFGEEDMDVDRMPFSYGPTNVTAFNFDNEATPVEEGSKKKKQKRSQAEERHVCIICGRTDSPEWRKGPQGPKTLCNACGLRWAKQVRKKNHTTSSPLASLPHTAEGA